jgi:nicotinamidase/pyrazinamidase
MMPSAMALHPQRDALLVVDLQHDFLPGGALGVAGGDAVVAPIAALAPRFATVVATQDWHPPGHVSFASSHPGAAPFTTLARPALPDGSLRPAAGGPQELWPDHCLRGSAGAALHPALPDAAVTLVLRKGTRREVDSYSAFRENVGPDGARPTTGLGAWLKARGVSRVFVCGLARDFCVRFSAVDAAAEGFEVVVLDDLTRAVFPAQAAATDAAFQAAGVKVGTSADLS